MRPVIIIENGKTRTIMARPRKQATTPRNPSGRLAKADRGEGETAAMLRMRAEANLKLVSQQPHRRGDGSALGGTLVGRLINAKRVRCPHGKWETGDFATVIDYYQRQVSNEKWLMDSKRPLAVISGKARPAPTDDEAAQIMRDGSTRRACLREAGECPAKAIQWMLEDAGPDQAASVVSFAYTYGASIALSALCELWIGSARR